MMEESGVCLGIKEIRDFDSFRPFFKIIEIFEKFWKMVKMNQKLRFLCFRGIHNSFPSFWAKLGYSRIKIDSLLKDAVLTVGVNLRLCLLFLWWWLEHERVNNHQNLTFKVKNLNFVGCATLCSKSEVMVKYLHGKEQSDKEK